MPTPDMTPENQALCDAARAVVERDFKPRPGGACSAAPNGLLYLALVTKPGQSASEAVQELEGRFRALIVEYPGDTVWWRSLPLVMKDDDGAFWRARCRLRLGWASDEIPEQTPGNPACEYGASYAEGNAAVAAKMPAQPGEGVETASGQLPRWKCHKEVQAAKITGIQTPEGVVTLVLKGGHSIAPEPGVVRRLLMTAGKSDVFDLVGGYFVRYAPDGYESWSPAKAFEDGYTRMDP